MRSDEQHPRTLGRLECDDDPDRAIEVLDTSDRLASGR